MKKITGLILIMMLLTSFQTAVFAGNPLDKLTRGITNVATAPGEFIHQIEPAKEQSSNFVQATLIGVLRGTFFTLKRALVGLYEVVTFPIPKPDNYEPVYEPEMIVKDIAKGSFLQ